MLERLINNGNFHIAGTQNSMSFGDCFSYKKLKNLHADFFESLSFRNKYLIIYEEIK